MLHRWGACWQRRRVEPGQKRSPQPAHATWCGPGPLSAMPGCAPQVGQGQGVLVERCRYLEQAGCASICINSCKVPTQVGRWLGQLRAAPAGGPLRCLLLHPLTSVASAAQQRRHRHPALPWLGLPPPAAAATSRRRHQPPPPPAAAAASRRRHQPPATSRRQPPPLPTRRHPSAPPPPQEFFAKDMGLALTMTPNYDDFSCQCAACRAC